MLLIHLLVHSYAKPPSSSQPTYSMNNAHEICQKKKKPIKKEKKKKKKEKKKIIQQKDAWESTYTL